MSRAQAIERLLTSTVSFCEAAAAQPRVLELVIGQLRRSASGAQEVDALHGSLADLLAGIGGLLAEEGTS